MTYAVLWCKMYLIKNKERRNDERFWHDANVHLPGGNVWACRRAVKRTTYKLDARFSAREKTERFFVKKGEQYD